MNSDRTPPDGFFEKNDCGDFDIRILKDGSWLHCGNPIQRRSLIKLFASVLRRDADGAYRLTTPAEDGRIVVDDVPFVAVAFSALGTGRGQVLSFVTNLDETVAAGPAHPIRIGGAVPYVMVRDGLEARIGRSVYYDLVEKGTEETIDGDRQFGVWSCGMFFALGRLDGAAR